MSAQHNNSKGWARRTPLACAILLAGIGMQSGAQAEEGFFSGWGGQRLLASISPGI